MPRIRTIKPELATDEKLAKVSRDARLTFVLCITQADDDGLLPGNSRQLLAALYPLDETMTDKILTYLLKELVESGRLRWRETRDGSPILQIVNWSAHQKIDHKAKSLLLPHLKEIGEESANVSRDPREDVASESRSYLGPRTIDQGPTTGGADAPVVVRLASPDVESVLAHFRHVHPKKRPDDKARRAITKALRSYSVQELCEAIDGNAGDKWCRETANQSLPYLLKDNAQIDKHRAQLVASQPRLAVDPLTGLPNAVGMAALSGRGA